jgi:hypothetical protein
VSFFSPVKLDVENKKSREVFLHGFFTKKNRRLSGLPAVFWFFLDNVLLSHRQSLAKIIIAKIPKIKISDCGAVHFMGALFFVIIC